MKRVATASILLVFVWVVCRHAPLVVFDAVAAGLAAGAAWECFRLLEATGAQPFRALGIVAVLVTCASFSTAAPSWLDPAASIVAATLACSLAALRSRGSPEAMLRALSATVFPVVLVGLGIGALVGLRGQAAGRGTDLVFLLILCVVASDTAAYYVGRAFGVKRLAPVVSPGKTWAGFWGGLLASALAALAARWGFFDDLPVVHALAAGLLIGLAGVLGDLTESAIKRAAGAKDSSSILPGHGGLLDRLDSMLFAAPILYYYCRLFLEGAP